MDELDVFNEALTRTDPAARRAFLDAACAGNPEMSRRFEQWLEGREPDRADPGATVDTASEVWSLRTEAIESLRADGSPPTIGDAGDGLTSADARSIGPKRGGSRASRDEGVGAVIAGRYTLLDVIGEGGMGSVYLADQSQPVKRRVALKLIRTGMDSRGVLARFDAERQALAMMDHPNIARIYDGGVTPAGQPFFVMELVQGVPLTDYCDRRRLPLKARLDLFAAVCHAVQHAHQKGVIHRDLKPGNVLVAEVDGRPTPKVIDFGVAKATEVKLTDMSFADVGAIVGTPSYMSPEQADPSSMDIDTRTDVYALGVMLYELLTGAPPIDASHFQRGAILEMLRMVREVDPPRPSTRVGTAETLPSIAAVRSVEPAQLRRALTGDLDWIVMKALEKDRTRRYDTANGLAADIARHLASEPVLAAPPSRAYRLRKFVRKNRGGVIAAGLVLCALVAGMVGTTWGLIQAERANRALAAKNVELAVEQAKVERRFELARKAIGTFHTGVSEDVLMKNDQFKELRTKLLHEAAGFYGDLEKLLVGQTDAKSLRLLAAGYAELGDLTGKIGDSAKALEVHRKALAVRRALAARPSANRETRLDVARTLGAVQDLLMTTGGIDEASSAFEELREIALALEAESPTDDVLEVLALAYASRGNILESTGRMREAREDWRKGSDLWSRLVDANPTEPRFLVGLAKSYSDLGVQLRMHGADLEDAVKSEERGVAILEKLVADFPTRTEFQFQLGVAYGDIGWSKSEMLWRPTEARAAFDRALTLQTKLAATYPAVNSYQFELMNRNEELASLLEYSGNWLEASEVLRRAAAVSQKLLDGNPGDLDSRWKHGMIHQAAGRCLVEMGRESEAMDALRTGLQSLQDVAKVDPAFEDSLRLVCWTQEDVGTLLERTGKPNEALQTYAETLAIGRKYVENHPNDPLFERRIAAIHALVGRLYADAERLPQALEAAQTAERIRRKLAADNAFDRRHLPRILLQKASILLRVRRPAEARALVDEAVPILTDVVKQYPGRPEFVALLALGHLRSGQLKSVQGDSVGAVADWKRAIETEKSIDTVLSGPQTFEYACAHAALAGATKEPAEADRAMALLKKATRMTFRNPATFRTEPALAPLRDRDDFKALMKDLEARAAGPLAAAPPAP